MQALIPVVVPNRANRAVSLGKILELVSWTRASCRVEERGKSSSGISSYFGENGIDSTVEDIVQTPC